MHADNDIEAELVELMAVTTKGLDPPTGTIIDEGVRRGQRMARHARVRGTVAAIGVLAVTAGATFGAVAVADRTAGTGHALGVAAPSASATPSASAAPSASAVPTTTPTATPKATPSATKRPKSATKHGQMSLEQVEAILADLLPPGRFVPLVTDTGPVREETHYGATYFPGTRGYTLAIDIVPSRNPDAENSSCPFFNDSHKRQAGAPPAGCEERNLPGGAHAVLMVTETDLGGLYEYHVVLDRADGTQVVMELANGTEGPDGQPGTVNAATPPITMDRLLTIAESDRWN